MSREILNAINVSLDGYSVLISLIIVISLFSLKKIDSSAKWFALTNIAALLYGGSDIFTWISEGTDATWKLFALPVATFIFYLSGCLLFLFYLRYIIVYYYSRSLREHKQNQPRPGLTLPPLRASNASPQRPAFIQVN